MGIEQGLIGIGLLLGGGGTLASAVVGLASSMDSGFGFTLATGGVVSMIIGYIMVKTNE